MEHYVLEYHCLDVWWYNLEIVRTISEEVGPMSVESSAEGGLITFFL